MDSVRPQFRSVKGEGRREEGMPSCGEGGASLPLQDNGGDPPRPLPAPATWRGRQSRLGAPQFLSCSGVAPLPNRPFPVGTHHPESGRGGCGKQVRSSALPWPLGTAPPPADAPPAGTSPLRRAPALRIGPASLLLRGTQFPSLPGRRRRRRRKGATERRDRGWPCATALASQRTAPPGPGQRRARREAHPSPGKPERARLSKGGRLGGPLLPSAGCQEGQPWFGHREPGLSAGWRR